MHSITRPLLIGYGVIAGLTLLFQIYVRYPACTGIDDCGVSFAKGAVWSVIWPASWYVYLLRGA
jgi:hypothetical protein